MFGIPAIPTQQGMEWTWHEPHSWQQKVGWEKGKGLAHTVQGVDGWNYIEDRTDLSVQISTTGTIAPHSKMRT